MALGQLSMWRAAVFWLMTACCALTALAEPAPIRIGITPAILHDRHPLMMELRRYLETKTGRPVALVPRSSYQQTIELVREGKVDFAWVSAYPFVRLRNESQARLLAAPVLNGRPYFRAYFIVPAADKTTTSLLQLEGKLFAYADRYSYTGYLVPRHELHQAGKDASRFFAKTFFTWGHKKVIRAVASGLADGGYVDSFVWDSLAATEPSLTAMTRIVSRSPECGSPPLVAGRHVSERDFEALRRVFLGMSSDPDGSRLLGRLHIDGFVVGDPKAYADVDRIMRVLGEP